MLVLQLVLGMVVCWDEGRGRGGGGEVRIEGGGIGFLCFGWQLLALRAGPVYVGCVWSVRHHFLALL